MKKAILYILAYIALIFLIVMIASGISANTYDSVNLKAFNRINGTSYTLDEWHVYSYEIKKLHPFNIEVTE